MGQPVVHFEIIGAEPEQLRSYYGGLFGWKFDTSAPVSPVVSEPTSYGFVDRSDGPEGIGIPGGVGGGAGYPSRVLIYVGVPDVGAALAKAERLGGTRVMGPRRTRARASWWATSRTHVATWSAWPGRSRLRLRSHAPPSTRREIERLQLPRSLGGGTTMSNRV